MLYTGPAEAFVNWSGHYCEKNRNNHDLKTGSVQTWAVYTRSAGPGIDMTDAVINPDSIIDQM